MQEVQEGKQGEAMREIKFRAKIKDGNEWMYGGGIQIIGPDTLMLSEDGGHGIVHLVQRDTVGQFTGLLDRNGKEIYEGDIIKYHYFYFADGSEIEKECVCSVKWDDTFANFDAMDKDGFAHFLGQASDDGIEVIGNIYEHPELLK